MRIPNWVRWVFYAMALGSTILTFFWGEDDPKVIFLFGHAVPICLAISFVFCSRYFIEIGKSDVVIGKIFGTRIFPISNITRILESRPLRGAKSLTAFDNHGSRLFVISDNVEDYLYVIGQLKLKLQDGVVREEPGWLSKTKTVIHHNDK